MSSDITHADMVELSVRLDHGARGGIPAQSANRLCGCGAEFVQGRGLVGPACWKASPAWMRKNVASKYPNQKAEARTKLIAFAVSRRSEVSGPRSQVSGQEEKATSMLGFCAYCPELLGRDAVFLGSKPGEGVSHGICPECEAVYKERYGLSLATDKHGSTQIEERSGV